jgi:hypothetical protein
VWEGESVVKKWNKVKTWKKIKRLGELQEMSVKGTGEGKTRGEKKKKGKEEGEIVGASSRFHERWCWGMEVWRESMALTRTVG